MINPLKKWLGSTEVIPQSSSLKDEFKSNLGLVEQININKGEYLITFPYPLEVPLDSPSYKIYKVKIYSKSKLYSLDELKKINPKKVKLNFNKEVFSADELLIKMISQTIRQNLKASEISNKHKALNLENNYWTYTYPQGFIGKTFDFSNDRSHSTMKSL